MESDLRKMSELFDALLAEVKSKFSSAKGCHDFEHIMRVVKNTEHLLTLLPEADREITLCGALMHDFCRREEDDSDGKLDHAALGEKVVYALLLDKGCPQEQAAAISSIVGRHRFRSGKTPETLEEKIVYDADKLDSLGAIGIGRAFLFAGKTGAKLHNSAEEALAGSAYSCEDTAFREYLVKLRHLPEKMQTLPGREIATKRLEFMTEFFERLSAEDSGLR